MSQSGADMPQFLVDPEAASPEAFSSETAAVDGASHAQELFERAASVEDADPRAAIDLYLQAGEAFQHSNKRREGGLSMAEAAHLLHVGKDVESADLHYSRAISLLASARVPDWDISVVARQAAQVKCEAGRAEEAAELARALLTDGPEPRTPMDVQNRMHMQDTFARCLAEAGKLEEAHQATLDAFDEYKMSRPTHQDAGYSMMLAGDLSAQLGEGVRAREEYSLAAEVFKTIRYEHGVDLATQAIDRLNQR